MPPVFSGNPSIIFSAAMHVAGVVLRQLINITLLTLTCSEMPMGGWQNLLGPACFVPLCPPSPSA